MGGRQWVQHRRRAGVSKAKSRMKLAELDFAMVPGPEGDECMFSALKCLKSPQRRSLREKHTDVCARGCKKGAWTIKARIGCWSSEICLVDLLVGDDSGAWTLGTLGDAWMFKLSCFMDCSACKAYEITTNIELCLQ
eukprot:1149589-Pelagomonas_calceolata.AAC.3